MFDIFVSDNGGPTSLWQSATGQTSAMFTGHVSSEDALIVINVLNDAVVGEGEAASEPSDLVVAPLATNNLPLAPPSPDPPSARFFASSDREVRKLVPVVPTKPDTAAEFEALLDTLAGDVAWKIVGRGAWRVKKL